MSHLTALLRFNPLPPAQPGLATLPPSRVPAVPRGRRETWPPTTGICSGVQGLSPQLVCVCVLLAAIPALLEKNPHRFVSLKLSTESSRIARKNVTLRWPNASVWRPCKTRTPECGRPGRMDTNIHWEWKNKNSRGKILMDEHIRYVLQHF